MTNENTINEAELATKMWKSLQSDMTVMLGITGLEEGHSRPMTAQFADDDDSPGGPIYFFTAKTGIIKVVMQQFSPIGICDNQV